MQTDLKRGSCNNKERHGCLRSQSETFEEAHPADTLILYSDLNNYEDKDCCSRHSSVLSGSRVRENLKISFSDFITIKNVKERAAYFCLPLFTLSTRGTQNSKIVNAVLCATVTKFCVHLLLRWSLVNNLSDNNLIFHEETHRTRMYPTHAFSSHETRLCI